MPIIREGRLEDLDTVMEIVSDVIKIMNAEGNMQWNEHYPKREHFELDVKNGDLYVAVEGDGVVGMIAINFDIPEEYAAVFDLNDPSVVPHRLGVSPRVQSKGIAQLLMSHCEVLGKKKGIDRVRVDTNDANERMKYILSNKLGYEDRGLIKLLFEPQEIYGKLNFRCFEKMIR